ncbi:MAG: hypothetical protein ACLSAF_06525 [Intestinimonas sp.]
MGREVYQRSAFVGQSGVPIDADPDLEKRIAALVSSGEEDVSYSQTEKTLRSWLNRRKHNKTGLIPRLEEEASALTERLAQARQAARRAAEAQAQIGALTRQKAELEAESAAQQARRDWAQAEQYRAAVRELEKARAELDSLEGRPSQTRKPCGRLGELAYLNVLAASLKEAKNQVEPARQAVEAAESAAVDLCFRTWTRIRHGGGPGRRPAGRALEKRAGTGLRAVGILFLAAAAVSAVIGGPLRAKSCLFVSAALEALAGVQSLLSAGRAEKRRVKAREEILSRYGAAFPDDILARANAYRDKWTAAEEARRGAEAVERSIRDLEGQRRALWDKLLSFVRTFAPEANDPFGASAALSRALGREERLSAARVKAQAAQRLVDSLPAPAGARAEHAAPPTERNPQQTAAALAAVGGRSPGCRASSPMPRDRERPWGTRRSWNTAWRRRRRRLRGGGASTAPWSWRWRSSPRPTESSGPVLTGAQPSGGTALLRLTGGKYEELTLTREFEAAAREAGGVLPGGPSACPGARWTSSIWRCVWRCASWPSRRRSPPHWCWTTPSATLTTPVWPWLWSAWSSMPGSARSCSSPAMAGSGPGRRGGDRKRPHSFGMGAGVTEESPFCPTGGRVRDTGSGRRCGAAVLHIDDAAAPEARPLDEALHGVVVVVGVDAQIGAPRPTEEPRTGGTPRASVRRWPPGGSRRRARR